MDTNGLYQNASMDYLCSGRFESQPWYIGVFAAEEGEPYQGWLWCKNFLELRKLIHDKQSTWCHWNAGWGQWGIDIDDPSGAPYIEVAHKLGVRGLRLAAAPKEKAFPHTSNLHALPRSEEGTWLSSKNTTSLPACLTLEG